MPNSPTYHNSDPVDAGLDDDVRTTVSFATFGRSMWAARGFVGTITAASVLLACLYLALRSPRYEAEAIIGPTQETMANTSGLPSGLTAAIGLGGALGGSGATYDKYLQLVHSRRLAEQLMKRPVVLEHLYPESWDGATQSWRRPTGLSAAVKADINMLRGQPAWTAPTADDLAQRLSKMVSVSNVEGSGVLGISALKSQIMRVSVIHRDREFAIALLGFVLRDADVMARQDKLTNTSNRIAYLSALTKKTTDVYLLNNLSQILMEQERTLMILNADKYYSVELIDPPNASPFPTGPSAVIVLLGAVLVGMSLSAGAVFWLLHDRLAKQPDVDPRSIEFPHPFRRMFGGGSVKAQAF